MRIRGVKTELEDAGEETEGMVDNTSKLQEKIMALTNIDGKGGINILTNTGEFKSTYEILLAISKVWKDMDDVSQAALLEVIAGKTRGSVVASLFQNGDILENAYKSASGASGSAMKELDTYLDSIQGRVDLFKNAVQSLWMNTISSDTAKGFVDAGTALIKFIDKLKMIPTLLFTILSYRSMFAKNRLDFASMLGIHELDDSFVKGFTVFGKKGLTGWIANKFKGKNNITSAILGDPSDVKVSVADFADAIRNNITDYVKIDTSQIDTQISSVQERLAVARQQLEVARKSDWTYYKSLGSMAPAQDRDNRILEQQQQVKSLEASLVSLKAKRDALVSSAVDTTAKSMVNSINNETRAYTSMFNVLTQVQGKKLYINNELDAATKIDQISLAAKKGQTHLVNYVSSLGDTDVALKAYVASVKDGNYSLAGFQQFILEHNDKIKKSGTAAKAAAIGHMALNMALSMGISLLISGAISLIGELTRLEEKAAKAAMEAVESAKSLGEQADSIKDYKDQIIELRKELDNNTLSESEAYDAREKLLTIQNDLIEKYGLEKDGINLVTGAINDQIAAIDELSKKNAQRWINTNQKEINKAIEYFDGDNQGSSLDGFWEFGNTSVSNWGLTKNVKKAIDEYANADLTDSISSNTAILTGEHWIDFHGSVEDVKSSVEDFQSWLETKENELLKQKAELLALPDQTDEVKRQVKSIEKDIKQLQDVREDVGAEYKNWFGDGSTYEANKALLEETQLNTAITQYSDQYEKILQAQKDFEDAVVSGDRDKMREAINVINAETSAAVENASTNGQSYMTEFFNGIKEEYAQQTKEFQIEWDIVFGGKDKQKAFSDMFANIKGMNAKELLQLENVDPDSVAFTSLKAMAESYEMSVEDLCSALVNLGHIQADFTPDSEKIGAISKTYTVLTEEIENYNNISSQTKEIIADGTKVTQEYKDSLLDLGISSSALNECFYESNGLIVKDAKALNDLVNEAKKSTVQNVQLAKSQARLEYYELYKEMKDLTKGTAVADAATLNYIDSLYEQMGVIEKTISKYSLLEAKLLGASNAYDKLAEAQEADEAVDYGSKAEEMIKVLGDAITSKELGTNAAQVAIDGIIPESELEGLTTAEEKMAAIYKYFTKGPTSKLFSLEFDDDDKITSVEMTQDNLKEYINSSDVFDGTWDNFTLDESIKSMEDFMAATNMTKEMAFAFFAELEKYDISWLDGKYDTLMDQLMGDDLDYQLQKAIEVAADVEKKLAAGALKITDEEYQTAQKNLEEKEESAMNNVVEWQKKQMGLAEQKAKVAEYKEELERAIEAGEDTSDIENNIIEASGKVDELLGDLRELSEPTEFSINVAKEEVKEDISEIKQDYYDLYNELVDLGDEDQAITLKAIVDNIDTSGFDGLEDAGFKQSSNGKWYATAEVEGWSKLDQKSQDMVLGYISTLENEHYINMAMEEPITIEQNLSTIITLLEKIADLLDIEYKIKLLASEAETRLITFKNKLEGIKDKTVNIFTNFVGAAKNLFGGGASVNGTAHANGTAYKNGSWGAAKTETSLVGELGPEILVRNGRWTTVGEDGAEFTNVKKGDIIFNHKQTESLLKNGYVAGRGRAYASGKDGSWFTKGAVEDGFNIKNLIKTFIGSYEDLKENIATGFLGFGEALVDAITTSGTETFSSVATNSANEDAMLFNIVGDKEFAQKRIDTTEDRVDAAKENAEIFVGKDLYNEKDLAKALLNSELKTRITGVDPEADSVFGDKADGLAQSVGDMLVTAAASPVVPWYLTSGINAFGSEADNAINQGATLDEAAISAAVTAGAEVLTEKISGISFGGETWVGALSDTLTKNISNKFAKKLVGFGLEHVLLGEGTEESLSELIGKFGQWLTYQDDKTLSEMFLSEEAFESYFDAYFGGFVLGEGNELVKSVTGKKTSDSKDTTNSSDVNTENNDIIAVHNMSVEKFLKAYQLGGLASPSIAVIKQGMTHTEFGGKDGVQIELPLSLIDPSIDSRNHIYGADAATPVVGTIQGLLKQTYNIDKINDIYKKITTLNQQAIKNAGFSDHPSVEAMLDGVRGFEWYTKLKEHTLGRLDEKLVADATPDILAHSLTFDESVRRAFLEDQGIKLPTEVDDYNYDEPIIYPGSTLKYHKKASKWLSNLLSEATIGSPEFNYDIEDIVKKMYEIRPYRSFSPLAAPEYTSIDQVKENAWKLDQDASGADGAYGAYADALLEKILLHKKTGPYDDSSINRRKKNSNIPNRIQIADSLYEEGIRGIKEIQKAFADAGEKLSIFDANRLNKLFIESDNRKVNYFEAKSERVVGFDEMLNVTVPEDFPADVLQQMINDGLDVRIRKSDGSIEKPNTSELFNEIAYIDAEIAKKKDELETSKNYLDTLEQERSANSLNFDLLDKYTGLIQTELDKVKVLECQLAELQVKQGAPTTTTQETKNVPPAQDQNINYTVDGAGVAAIEKIADDLGGVVGDKFTNYNVNGSGTADVARIESGWANVPSNKTTNYTVNTTYTSSGSQYPGWTHTTGGGRYTKVDGTAHASGSWGIPTDENGALVGELGPEMLVRGSRWHLIGENGAEFTNIKKGDIIFNHKQTESLLKNGYVTGRGKAYASGTTQTSGSAYAYAIGANSKEDQKLKKELREEIKEAVKEVGGTTADAVKIINAQLGVLDTWGGTPDLSKDYNKKTSGSGSGSGGSGGSGSSDDADDILDWIEIRMEELDEVLAKLNAELENAVGYAAKNNKIDAIIAKNREKLADSKAGAEYYENYAKKYYDKIDTEYQEMAKNGAIAITDFAGKASEETLDAINKYREYIQKASDLNQQAEELLTEIRDLAIQRFNNAYDDGSVRATVEDSQTGKLQNAVDYDEERGLITSDAYYIAMMENSNKKIEYLTSAREAMQKELDRAVEAGEIIRGSNEWYELIDQMYQIDSEIDEATMELEEFQNAINDIYWDNFDQLINRLDYLKDETQSLIDLMDNADLVTKPSGKTYENGTVKYWTAEDVQWTEEGMASLGLYAQQMEIAEYQSKQYAEAISDLTKDYENGLYSENEYLEKLEELKSAQYDCIESYYDAQDAIVELNEARVDSIKEGIEKEIDAYEELIEKQKEALDSERDLYDFQRSVSEKQKSIAEIERQLAALANDTSLSAAAKRKKLEADLAEAQYDLEDAYYNRSVEDKETALDKELEAFEKEKEKEIEKWDEYLENVEALITESLGIVQQNASEIGETLTSKAEEYSLTISDAVLTPWKDGSLAVSDYQTTFDTAMSSTMDQLEALKQKWQEVIDKMAEAGKAAVDAFDKENDEYTSAEYKEPETPKQEEVPEAEKTIQVGGKIDASGAKIYGYAGDKSGKKQYYSNDPVYVVLEEKNGYLKVRHHSVKSGTTGWFKKSDVKAYAKGTTGVNKSQLALIDELGDELIMHADGSGRLAFLSKGSAVIPHDISENLMKLGSLDPSDVLSRTSPQIGVHPEIHNTEISINMNIAEVVHIDEVTNDTLPDLTKAVKKQMDSYMKDINNSLRRFTR